MVLRAAVFRAVGSAAVSGVWFARCVLYALRSSELRFSAPVTCGLWFAAPLSCGLWFSRAVLRVAVLRAVVSAPASSELRFGALLSCGFRSCGLWFSAPASSALRFSALLSCEFLSCALRFYAVFPVFLADGLSA